MDKIQLKDTDIKNIITESIAKYSGLLTESWAKMTSTDTVFNEILKGKIGEAQMLIYDIKQSVSKIAEEAKQKFGGVKISGFIGEEMVYINIKTKVQYDNESVNFYDEIINNSGINWLKRQDDRIDAGAESEYSSGKLVFYITYDTNYRD